MPDVDAVARRIRSSEVDRGIYKMSWDEMPEQYREEYRTLARAAVSALQLTEETTSIFKEFGVHRRLVGPWVRCQEDQ